MCCEWRSRSARLRSIAVKPVPRQTLSYLTLHGASKVFIAGHKRVPTPAATAPAHKSTSPASTLATLFELARLVASDRAIRFGLAQVVPH